MSHFKKLLILSAICLSVFACYGQEEHESLESVFFRDFDDDSYFVTIPTYTGNYLGVVIGAVPAAVVAGGFQFADASPATVTESARVTLAVFAKSIGLLFGLPFKLAKSIAWDAPKYVITGVSPASDPPLELPEEKKLKE